MQKKTYSTLSEDLYVVYISDLSDLSGLIASSKCFTSPPSHNSCFLALPHGVSTFCKSSGKYKLSYPIFLLEAAKQLDYRHVPGAKSLKLGNNLGAQDTRCLIRAVILTPPPSRGVCASEL